MTDDDSNRIERGNVTIDGEYDGEWKSYWDPEKHGQMADKTNDQEPMSEASNDEDEKRANITEAISEYEDDLDGEAEKVVYATEPGDYGEVRTEGFSRLVRDRPEPDLPDSEGQSTPGGEEAVTWPEGVDPEELTDNQKEIIQLAMANRDWTNTKIAGRVGVGGVAVSKTLSSHWPERSPGKGKGTNPNPETMETVRKRLLDGHSLQNISDDLPVGETLVHKIATGTCGMRWRVLESEVSTPPLEYDRTAREWVVASGSNPPESAEPTSGTNSSRQKVPDGEIEDIRRRALAGESAATIAGEYDCHRRTLSRYLGGSLGDDSASTTPPLDYDNSAQEWVMAEDSENPGPSDRIGLKSQDVEEIRYRLLGGETTCDLGEHFGVSDVTVLKTAKGERGKSLEPGVDVPPLEYDHGEGEWNVADNSEDRPTPEPKPDDEPTQPTEDTQAEQTQPPDGGTHNDFGAEFHILRSTIDTIEAVSTNDETMRATSRIREVVEALAGYHEE